MTTRVLLCLLLNQVCGFWGPKLKPEDPKAVRNDVYAKNLRFNDNFQGRINPSKQIPDDLIGVCNETFVVLQSGSKATFATPGFESETYPTNTDCIYTIETAPGLRIIFEFMYVDLEPGPPTCPFDYIEIFDGTDLDKPWRNERICGADRPGNFYSTSNYMQVKFHSDEADTRRGAAFRFKIFKEETLKTFSCDFENRGLCDIEFIEGGQFMHITSGPTPTYKAGPLLDHTFLSADKGRYLYFESSGHSGEVKVVFKLPKIYMYVLLFLALRIK